MKPMNIYLSGVGGQGIGLLTEILSRACLAAGHTVHGCDTHGLAQRGGTVVSHLRLGEAFHTPRVPAKKADLVIGLERLEALRAADLMLAPGKAVVYYDTMYQPIHVRMGRQPYPKNDVLKRVAKEKGARVERVFVDDLPDPRMQNVALLGRIAALGLIEGVSTQVVEDALREVIPEKALDSNLAVFWASGRAA